MNYYSNIECFKVSITNLSKFINQFVNVFVYILMFLFVELLGKVSDQLMASLRYTVNKTTVANSSLNIHIRNISVAIDTSDLFEYGM